MVAVAKGMATMISVLNGIKKVGPNTWKNFGAGMKDLREVAKEGLGEVKDALSQFIDFNQVMEPIAQLFGPVNAVLEIFTAGMTEGLAPAMEDLYEAFLDPQAVEMWLELGSIMGEAVAQGVTLLVDLFDAMIKSGAIEEITAFLKDNHDVLVALFGDLLMIIPPLLEQGLELITALIQFESGEITASEAISKIGLSLFELLGPGGIIIGQFDEFGAKITEGWGALFGENGLSLDRFGDSITGTWNELFSETSEKGLVGVLAEFATFIIDYWKNLFFPETAGVPGVTGETTTPAEEEVFANKIGLGLLDLVIPGLGTAFTLGTTFMANGGITRGPTRAMIGEAGPEAVIPLDEGANELSGVLGPNITINITGPIGDEQIREIGRRMQILGATEFTGRGMSF